ncbi:MAG: hypothetical protein K0A98_08860 [Trueperaceae bacterium]|nr:hypothetical protein [Trueperaceae bacterium]
MLRGATKRVSLVKGVRRSWPLLLVATGLAVFGGGFAQDVAFAGIPYQDPTPERAADFIHRARGLAGPLGGAGPAAVWRDHQLHPAPRKTGGAAIRGAVTSGAAA